MYEAAAGRDAFCTPAWDHWGWEWDVNHIWGNGARLPASLDRGDWAGRHTQNQAKPRVVLRGVLHHTETGWWKIGLPVPSGLLQWPGGLGMKGSGAHGLQQPPWVGLGGNLVPDTAEIPSTKTFPHSPSSEADERLNGHEWQVSFSSHLRLEIQPWRVLGRFSGLGQGVQSHMAWKANGNATGSLES